MPRQGQYTSWVIIYAKCKPAIPESLELTIFFPTAELSDFLSAQSLNDLIELRVICFFEVVPRHVILGRTSNDLFFLLLFGGKRLAKPIAQKGEEQGNR